MVAKKVYISGKVQGVGFRFHAHEKAYELGVKGWVRNLKDGRVELFLVGSEQAVTQMLAWCHQGPPAAKVEKVEAQESSDKIEQTDFYIRRD
ncbi:MAG: acylphosphatase [Oligoflexia bacterium]|nr:acylphosphatase [Oligoflexia bacterium]